IICRFLLRRVNQCFTLKASATFSTLSTVTGTSSVALNGATLKGNVVFGNNGDVTLQQLTLADGASATIGTGTNLTLDQSTLPSGTINMAGGTLTDSNAHASSGPLTVNFVSGSGVNTVSLNGDALSNATFKNVSPEDIINVTSDYYEQNGDTEKLIDVKDGVVELVYYNSWDSKTQHVLATFDTAQKSDGSYYKVSDFTSSYANNTFTLDEGAKATGSTSSSGSSSSSTTGSTSSSDNSSSSTTGSASSSDSSSSSTTGSASSSTVSIDQFTDTSKVIGADGQTTTVTGTSSVALNGATLKGNVVFGNNGDVTLQQLTLADGASATIGTGTNLTLDQSTLPSGTINMAGGTLTDSNAYASSGPLTVNFVSGSGVNTVSLNGQALSNATFKNVSPEDIINVTGDYYGDTEKLIDVKDGVVELVYYNSWDLKTPHVLATFDTAQKSDGSYYKVSDFTSSYANNTFTLDEGANSRVSPASTTVPVTDFNDASKVIGSDGQTTTVTGTSSSALNGGTVKGNVVFGSNGDVTLQQLTLDSNASVTIDSGTNLTLDQSTLPSGTITLNGGTLNNTNALSSSGPLTIAFGSTPSTVTLDAYALSNVTFTNVTPEDTINLHNSYGEVSLVDDGTGIIKVLSKSGQTLTYLHTGQKSDGSYYTASDFTDPATDDNASITGGDDTVVCFLAGSMIRTPSGLTAVEALETGDDVLVYDNGQPATQRVTWAGQAHCTVRPELTDDEAGYPVRILKDAIEKGVPFKDLLITAEHCLFFDGKFIPARMLVNGRSVFYDKSITSYDYYHIETEQHSVIMADGTLTESYLDTGNRRAFTQKSAVISMAKTRELTWDDAAAPLGVTRDFVEPVYRKIEARAEKANRVVQAEPQPLTKETKLHLTTESGAVIRQAREHNGRAVFMIPGGVNAVRIVTRASRPSDVIGPFIDDRRYFGIAVGEVSVFERNKMRQVTSHLVEHDIDGWNGFQGHDMRWTSGNALLSLGERAADSIALLSIEIKETTHYTVEETAAEAATLRA
ncbi:Hint domain-containing protein, partial [Acetobacter thailandicus]|uniref:Hint domain-containing protein n=1 Tax=Acetobacter thailandicus TaxID=1502842 RepID=UPI002010E72A